MGILSLLLPISVLYSFKLRQITLSYLFLLMMLTGCSSPQQHIDTLAVKSGLSKKTVTGKLFEHTIYFNQVLTDSPVLHVYIEGDGSPWISEVRVSLDPTPRNPIMLKLMGLDNNPSLYLGRPCYHGTSAKSPCHFWFWTSGRYSEFVLHSMEMVLRDYLNHFQYKKLIFFGHSGGGTLAMLLADRFKQTSMVVTIGGNLNPSAWTEFHGYTPLYGSLNPATMPPLDAKIRQYHLSGLDDTILPSQIIKDVVNHQSIGQLFLVDGYTHNCCWEEIWPEVLNCIDEKCQLNTIIN